MEDKRKMIFKKLDNFIFNSRNLNIITAVVLAVFILSYTVIFSMKSSYQRYENERYERMLSEIEKNQLNIIYSNVSEYSGNSTSSGEIEYPIFKNAKEAVATAFEKYYNYKTYEMKGNGVSNAEAVGQHVEVKNTSLSVKYANGEEYERSCRLETKTNFGQTAASETIYKNGKKYTRQGSDVRTQGDECVANFSGEFKQVDSSITKMTTLLINNDTIQFQRSFSFVRDKNNKILYYKATVTVDPELSTKEYGQTIMEEGGTSFPIFSKIEVSCIIDRDGHLVSWETTEVMKVSKRIIFDITTSITNVINHILLSHDETPSTQMP